MAAASLDHPPHPGIVPELARTRRPPDGERLVELYLRYTPVLWLIGLLTPFAALLTALPLLKWPRGRGINLVVCCWIGIGLAQLYSAFINAWLLGHPLTGTLRQALSFGVLGWIFAGLAIALGHAWRLTTPGIVRATCFLGLSVLVLGLLAEAASLTGLPSPTVRTLIGLALPENSRMAQAGFTAIFYIFEDSFGDDTTRLVLFFPWPTALAMGCIAIALISLHERSLLHRCLGLLGGVTGIVFSWSRTGVIAFIAGLLVVIALRLDRLTATFLAMLAGVGLFVLVCAGFNPLVELREAREAVDGARSGSSMARELIYERSWEEFLNAPLIGHGWIGESVHRTEELPIGSHSTVYGLLYTGGVLTFGMFVLALGTTLAATARAAAGPDPSGSARTAFALALTLLIFCPYEMLFSFSLPCLFLFTWIGGALRESGERA